MATNCPHCGHTNFDDAKICRRCRKDISNRCPECGAIRPPSASFCTQCGNIYKVKIDTQAYKTIGGVSPASADGLKSVVPVHRVTRELKRCPECSHKVDVDAMFCIYCGFVFDPRQNPKAAEPTPAPPPEPPKAVPPKKGPTPPAKPEQSAKGKPTAGPDKADAGKTAAAPGRKAPAAPASAKAAPQPTPGAKPPAAKPAAKPATGQAATTTPAAEAKPAAPAAKAPAPRPSPAPPAASEPEKRTPPRPQTETTQAASAPPRPRPTAPTVKEEPAAAPPRPHATQQPPSTPEPLVAAAPPEAKPETVEKPQTAEKPETAETPEAAAEPQAASAETEQKGPRTRPSLNELPPGEEIFYDPRVNPFMNLSIEDVDLEHVPGLVPLSADGDYTKPEEIAEGAGSETDGARETIRVEIPASNGSRGTRAVWIDRLPVTNDDYRAFVAATGSEPPSDWLNGRCLHGMGRYPVTMISFEQARAYARWAGKRLASAEEWEIAGGALDGRSFPWGDDSDAERAHFAVERRCLTEVDAHPAGASPFGCLDMIGNAAEWTVDETREEPILKGGSYLDDPRFADLRRRVRVSPTSRSPLIGFRCVKDAE